jgi:hypothetical protein
LVAKRPGKADEDSLLAVDVAIGVAISVVAVTSTEGTNNERGDCGGREAEAAMATRGGNGRRL